MKKLTAVFKLTVVDTHKIRDTGEGADRAKEKIQFQMLTFVAIHPEKKEDNTFTNSLTPAATINIQNSNPDLFDTFVQGDLYKLNLEKI